MDRVKIVIDGTKFSNAEEFFTEMDHLLTKDLDWQPGHGLDAFNDLLRGGFGAHAYGQGLDIRWIHGEKSRQDLGYQETKRYWEKVLERCHPSSRAAVQQKIQAACRGEGATLFDLLVEIILDTDNSGHDCTLVFED